jgi:hypothetical protein
MAPEWHRFERRIPRRSDPRPLRRDPRAWLGALLIFSAWACGTSTGSSTPYGMGNGSGASSSGSSGSSSGASSGSGSSASGSGGGTTTDATAPPATTASDAAGGSDAPGDGTVGGGGCTREGLTAAINAYFTALAAHDPTMAPLSTSVKYTESGKQVQVGAGEWKTAAAVKFKRSALDTQICNSVTESVIGDSGGDLVYGLRLALVNGKITEIETIPVHSGQYITDSPQGLAGTSSDDWETVLPAAQQGTRADLQSLMDVYFSRFPNGACNFASDCTRVEDGQSVGGCTGSGIACADSGSGVSTMTARLHVIDVEAGISIGFTMFAGTYTDFHMFKVRGGQVHGVHAILASASSSGWN